MLFTCDVLTVASGNAGLHLGLSRAKVWSHVASSDDSNNGPLKTGERDLTYPR